MRGVVQDFCQRVGQRVRELRAQGDAGQGVCKRRISTHGRRGGAWAPPVQHMGFENIKRGVRIVNWKPDLVADAKRVLDTVCVPCVDGKIAHSLQHHSTTTTTKCELIHTDVDGPLTESLGGSVYFLTLLDDSTGLITVMRIKTKGMVPDVIKTRNNKLETLTGLSVKRLRHDGAKEYVSHDHMTLYDDKGIKSEKTAPYLLQQKGEAERANRFIMERVREALVDAGVEEELWAEAFSSVIHMFNRSPNAGQDVTPLEAPTGGRPDVKGFRVCGSRTWAFMPEQQQRKLEPKTDLGRFLGYNVGGKAYRILEDCSNKIFERRDVLMEEVPSKTVNKTSASESSASPRPKAWTDGSKEDGAMDMLDAEVPSGDKYAPRQASESDGAPEEEAVYNAEDGDEDDAGEDAAAQKDHQVLPDSTTESGDDGAQAPWQSNHKPAPKGTWWKSSPNVCAAAGPLVGAKSAWDVSKPRTSAEDRRARWYWPIWEAAEKD